MKRSILNAKTLFLALGLIAASTAFGAAPFGPKAKLTCDFPAAQVPQRVKPGNNAKVSDGALRINAESMNFKICDGCAWQKSAAKWKVTPTQYLVKAPSGIEITISRTDGSAVFAVTTKEDEYYLPAHAESRGQCKVAEKAAGKS